MIFFDLLIYDTIFTHGADRFWVIIQHRSAERTSILADAS